MKIVALIRLTFRELVARATVLVLAAISTVIIIGVAVSLSVEQTAEGMVPMLFGNPAGPPVTQERLTDLVAGIQAGLAGGMFTGVILFGLFATAGILPDALERGTVDLYLSKPIARWQLLLGKYLGAVVVIGLNILYFIGVLWIVFGLKFGVWNGAFLLSILLLTVLFASLYALIALLGVGTRNTAITIIGAFLYLLVIGNLLEHRARGLYILSENPVYRGALDALYYILPQLTALQQNIAVQIGGQAADWRPVLQSLLSGALLLGTGALVLRKKDF